jgi:hypothetical protein
MLTPRRIEEQQVRRTVRCTTTFGVSAAVTLVLAIGAAGPAAAKATPKISNKDACTLVTTKQAERFGKPVGTPTPSAAKLDCKLAVGDPVAGPGGTLTALLLYPNPFAAQVDNALLGVEDQLAIDQLSDQDLQDVGALGRSAYLNRTKGEVVFAPNKKLGVILNWAPAPAGTPLTERDQKNLIALAKAVTKRANN